MISLSAYEGASYEPPQHSPEICWTQSLVDHTLAGMSIVVPAHPDKPITVRWNIVGNVDLEDEQGNILGCTRVSEPYMASHGAVMIAPTNEVHTYTLRRPGWRTVAPAKRSWLQRLLRR